MGSVPERVHAPAEHLRIGLGKSGTDRHRPGIDLTGRDDFFNRPDLGHPRGVDPSAGQQQVGSQSPARALDESVHPASARHGTHGQLRQAERRRLASDDDVASQRHLEPSTQYVALNSGDGRKRNPV